VLFCTFGIERDQSEKKGDIFQLTLLLDDDIIIDDNVTGKVNRDRRTRCVGFIFYQPLYFIVT